MEAQPVVSAQLVGNAFVQQYYQILHHSPSLAHRFYQDVSKLGRPQDDGTMTITTTMAAIDEKILSLNYDEYKAEIISIDAQDSFNLGVQVLVTGYLIGKDNNKKHFAQTFFLAPQERGGYFVLNDIFRYIEKVEHPEADLVAVEDVDVPFAPEQGSLVAAPAQEDDISEQLHVCAEEANEEEVQYPSGNGEIEVVNEEPPVVEAVEQEVPSVEVEEEEPIAEVINEVPDDWQLVDKSNIKTDETPKKSYASIVMDLKDKALPFSSPVLRKVPAKSHKQENPAPHSTSLTEASVSSLDATENGVNQEGEADGYSIYIKGLPHNATPSMLQEEFKKFGTIKSNGIQVRGRLGFCFGFVEFEEASAVEKAIEASPITIGGRNAVVEEKKSTNSRGNMRGRFLAGRGPGFRNEVGFRNDSMRGRGNYGGGRVYNRGESNGRIEYSRGNSRGGSASYSGDGYQRVEAVGTNGGRLNRVNGASAKNLSPRVSATA